MTKERYLLVLSGNVPDWPIVALFRCAPGLRWRAICAAVKREVRKVNNDKPVPWRDIVIDPAPGDVDHGTDAEILAGQRTFFERTKVSTRFEIGADGAVRRL